MDAPDRTESSDEPDQAREKLNPVADFGATVVGDGIVAGVGKVVQTVVDAVLS